MDQETLSSIPQAIVGDAGIGRISVFVAATFPAPELRDFFLKCASAAGIELDATALPDEPFDRLDVLIDRMRGKRGGVNLILTLPEQWFDEGFTSNRLRELLLASTEVVAPLVIGFCPVGGCSPDREAALKADLETLPEVSVFTSAELFDLYPLCQSGISDSENFWISVASMATRRLYALRAAPRKVIVLDCDNTLWSGICGEDELSSIIVDSARQSFQSYLLRQRESGMLLCLCSRNNPEDVWRVFSSHPSMVLREEHVTAAKIGWQPKCAGLRELSNELDLSTKSMIFFDDDETECAMVRSVCPDILTLNIPREASSIGPLVRRVWDLDSRKITEEDRNRPRMYRDVFQRSIAARQSTDLDEFLLGLELIVEIYRPAAQDLARLAQLTRRTTQFNLNSIQRSETELARANADSAKRLLAVRATDRFGDYGIVGTMLLELAPGRLQVHTFLLSCRALGKRIEHRMLTKICEHAAEHGIANIVMHYIQTARNTPMTEFLQEIGCQVNTWSVTLKATSLSGRFSPGT